MGLLSKASEIDNHVSLAFSDFILKHNIKFFAIFRLRDNFYNIINSIGFDGKSIISSESSIDFWNGICENTEEIYNFTCYNKSLNPILQFFSFNMKDKINTVSLYKKENFIYMICNKEIDNLIISDLSNIDFSKTNISFEKINSSITSNTILNEIEVNLNEAVISYINSKHINTTFDYTNVILNEMYNRFTILISPLCTKRISDSKLRILINTNHKISIQHLYSHIISIFTKVIGNSAELIDFNKLGEAESINDLNDFFQVE